jgi:5-methylcytosine-specific restriction enzyme subunit McrC
MPTLSLTEYRSERGVALGCQHRDVLLGLGTKLAVSPEPGVLDLYCLTPTSWVGGIGVGELRVEIRPKLDIACVVFMISYALDPRHWRPDEVGFVKSDSLVEAKLPGFVRQTRRAIGRGVLRGYRVEEEALPTVRGRLRFDDQIRRRFGIFPPAEVRYDEFTADIVENRLLRAAISRLARLRLRHDDSRRALRTLDSALDEVSLVDFDANHLPEVAYTRLNEHYRPAVELAKLILRATSFELGAGGVRSSAFLVDMNAVFEDFVVVALREALGVNPRTFPQGSKEHPLYLDQARRVRLKPDISWWDGNDCRFVGDLKYKRLGADAVVNADVYQLLAYSLATNLPGGMLVYAAGEAEPTVHCIPGANKELDVVTLDVSGSSEEVLARVGALARRIEEWRARATSYPPSPAGRGIVAGRG